VINVKDVKKTKMTSAGAATSRRYYYIFHVTSFFLLASRSSLLLPPSPTLFRPADSLEILSLLDILDRNLQGNVAANGIFRTSVRARYPTNGKPTLEMNTQATLTCFESFINFITFTGFNNLSLSLSLARARAFYTYSRFSE